MLEVLRSIISGTLEQVQHLGLPNLIKGPCLYVRVCMCYRNSLMCQPLPASSTIFKCILMHACLVYHTSHLEKDTYKLHWDTCCNCHSVLIIRVRLTSSDVLTVDQCSTLCTIDQPECDIHDRKIACSPLVANRLSVQASATQCSNLDINILDGTLTRSVRLVGVTHPFQANFRCPSF